MQPHQLYLELQKAAAMDLLHYAPALAAHAPALAHAAQSVGPRLTQVKHQLGSLYYRGLNDFSAAMAKHMDPHVQAAVAQSSNRVTKDVLKRLHPQLDRAVRQGSEAVTQGAAAHLHPQLDAAVQQGAKDVVGQASEHVRQALSPKGISEIANSQAEQFRESLNPFNMFNKKASYLPVYAFGGLGGAAIGALTPLPEDPAMTPQEARLRRLGHVAAGTAAGLGSAALVHAFGGDISDLVFFP